MVASNCRTATRQQAHSIRSRLRKRNDDTEHKSDGGSPKPRQTRGRPKVKAAKQDEDLDAKGDSENKELLNGEDEKAEAGEDSADDEIEAETDVEGQQPDEDAEKDSGAEPDEDGAEDLDCEFFYQDVESLQHSKHWREVLSVLEAREGKHCTRTELLADIDGDADKKHSLRGVITPKRAVGGEWTQNTGNPLQLQLDKGAKVVAMWQGTNERYSIALLEF